jgi:hypothetical protein
MLKEKQAVSIRKNGVKRRQPVSIIKNSVKRKADREDKREKC